MVANSLITLITQLWLKTILDFRLKQTMLQVHSRNIKRSFHYTSSVFQKTTSSYLFSHRILYMLN